MSMWNALSGLFSALGSLMSPRPQVPEPPKPQPPTWVPPAAPPYATRQELLDAHNQFRASHGVPALGPNLAVDMAAQSHADWMAANRNMSHVESQGTDKFYGATVGSRLANAGFPFSAAGENVAAGQTSVQRVVDDWIHSHGHRDNMLNPNYRVAGFGVAKDEYGHLYWCAVFASPMRNRVIPPLRVSTAVVVSTPPAVVRG